MCLLRKEMALQAHEFLRGSVPLDLVVSQEMQQLEKPRSLAASQGSPLARDGVAEPAEEERLFQHLTDLRKVRRSGSRGGPG